MKIHSILIVGKRWFDKVNENTYHSVYIEITFYGVFELNTNTIYKPFSNGNDNMYLQTASKLLETYLQGKISQTKLQKIKVESIIWKKLRLIEIGLQNKIKVYKIVSDVTRKKDL